MKKLSRAAQEARRAYMRQWRASNRDKTRAYRASYWERKAQAAKEAEKGGEE